MNVGSLALIGGAGALVGYTYAGYPLLLKAIGAVRPRPVRREEPEEWPLISITVPAYNEEAQIRTMLDSLLALDYPADRRQILVVSDASSDRTDEIVAEYADRGVELLRTPGRMGKTAAENLARPRLRGDIIVNTDASIRIQRDALKRLVACFSDPEVGLASGRDMSVGPAEDHPNAGESGYVGYEMWVRQLETRVNGIIGASGCFYAIRAELHHSNVMPEGLSRDFAAALVTREHGYRSVSVDDAVCFVPRTASLRREYQRKVRTMARGLQTLHFKRHLLNPLRYGSFSWMLLSHKLCRWLVPWAGISAAAGVLLLARREPWAQWMIGAMAAATMVAAAGWMAGETRRLPRFVAIPTFAIASNVAALHAWGKAVRGEANAVWEPTRREVVKTA